MDKPFRFTGFERDPNRLVSFGYLVSEDGVAIRVEINETDLANSKDKIAFLATAFSHRLCDLFDEMNSVRSGINEVSKTL